MNNYIKNCRLVILHLGDEYLVSMWGKIPIRCRFIQPTEKGFNFLNLETSKCILKPHLYPSKKIGTGNTFFLYDRFWATKITDAVKKSA